MTKTAAFAFAILALVSASFPISVAHLAIKKPVEKRVQRKRRVMGTDLYIHLFDTRIYSRHVLPAYAAFLQDRDPAPLVDLLRECICTIKAHPHLSEQLLWDTESCEEDIRIISGAERYDPSNSERPHTGDVETSYHNRCEYARGLMGSNILLVLCVPHDRGVNPEQNMGRASIVPYLYKHSEWIEELFTRVREVRGGALEPSIGDSSELFRKEDVNEFKRALDEVPRPDEPALIRDFDNLHALVQLASDDPDLTLALSQL